MSNPKRVTTIKPDTSEFDGVTPSLSAWRGDRLVAVNVALDAWMARRLIEHCAVLLKDELEAAEFRLNMARAALAPKGGGQ